MDFIYIRILSNLNIFIYYVAGADLGTCERGGGAWS